MKAAPTLRKEIGRARAELRKGMGPAEKLRRFYLLGAVAALEWALYAEKPGPVECAELLRAHAEGGAP